MLVYDDHITPACYTGQPTITLDKTLKKLVCPHFERSFPAREPIAHKPGMHYDRSHRMPPRV